MPTSLPALTTEGRLFTPREALQLGLVHELAPETDLLETALRRAAALAALPPAGVRQVKADLRRAAARAARDSSAEQTEQWLDSWFDPGAQERLRAAVARLRT